MGATQAQSAAPRWASQQAIGSASTESARRLALAAWGEVYRVRDARLKREIALKVLPETTAADPDRRARFEREAQSIAALSHPNIVTIYSVEEGDGVLFLTMEYVEGKPLSDLIVKGGLPLTQILSPAVCTDILHFSARVVVTAPDLLDRKLL